jgi:hypothetical protein
LNVLLMLCTVHACREMEWEETRADRPHSTYRQNAAPHAYETRIPPTRTTAPSPQDAQRTQHNATDTVHDLNAPQQPPRLAHKPTNAQTQRDGKTVRCAHPWSPPPAWCSRGPWASARSSPQNPPETPANPPPLPRTAALRWYGCGDGPLGRLVGLLEGAWCGGPLGWKGEGAAWVGMSYVCMWGLALERGAIKGSDNVLSNELEVSSHFWIRLQKGFIISAPNWTGTRKHTYTCLHTHTRSPQPYSLAILPPQHTYPQEEARAHSAWAPSAAAGLQGETTERPLLHRQPPPPPPPPPLPLPPPPRPARVRVPCCYSSCWCCRRRRRGDAARRSGGGRRPG